MGQAIQSPPYWVSSIQFSVKLGKWYNSNLRFAIEEKITWEKKANTLHHRFMNLNEDEIVA